MVGAFLNTVSLFPNRKYRHMENSWVSFFRSAVYINESLMCVGLDLDVFF